MPFAFIYGTLKRGFQNDALRPPEARFVDVCRTTARFPLIIGGKWFSPMLLDEPGSGERVAGELFSVSDSALGQLDLLEGANVPGGYRRIIIRVEPGSNGAAHEAFTYVKSRGDAGIIRDGPIPEYSRDPRYVLPGDRDRVFD